MGAVYIPETGQWLARFRVDPALVRVSVRKCPFGFGWQVTVASRDGGKGIIRRGEPVEEAIEVALEEAGDMGMSGIDISMERSYVHPWGEVSAKAAA